MVSKTATKSKDCMENRSKTGITSVLSPLISPCDKPFTLIFTVHQVCASLHYCSLAHEANEISCSAICLVCGGGREA